MDTKAQTEIKTRKAIIESEMERASATLNANLENLGSEVQMGVDFSHANDKLSVAVDSFKQVETRARKLHETLQQLINLQDQWTLLDDIEQEVK